MAAEHPPHTEDNWFTFLLPRLRENLAEPGWSLRWGHVVAACCRVLNTVGTGRCDLGNVWPLRHGDIHFLGSALLVGARKKLRAFIIVIILKNQSSQAATAVARDKESCDSTETRKKHR